MSVRMPPGGVACVRRGPGTCLWQLLRPQVLAGGGGRCLQGRLETSTWSLRKDLGERSSFDQRGSAFCRSVCCTHTLFIYTVYCVSCSGGSNWRRVVVSDPGTACPVGQLLLSQAKILHLVCQVSEGKTRFCVMLR